MAFLHGLGIGLSMMIFIGPVFFYLLQTALQYGTRSGLAAAVGIFMSDLTAIALCYFWARNLFENNGNSKFWLAVIGGVIVIIFGFNYITRPKLPSAKPVQVKRMDMAGFFTKAFLINFVNPFVFAVWISVIGFAQNKYDTTHEVVTLLAAALLGVISTDTLKVIGAKYLKRIIEPHFLIKLYKVIGSLLIGFGLRLFWYAINLKFQIF